MVLSGGSTPKPLYELLAGSESPVRNWAPVDFFWGDERCVPPDHPESNYGMARRVLLDQIGIAPSRIHRMYGELAPQQAAQQYCGELRRCFGISENDMPRFDLVLLGLGADGHTASLFPGSRALEEQRRPVVAVYVEKLGSHRITLSLPAINNADCVVFLVTGEAKAEILRSVVDPADSEIQPPAALVRPSGRLIILTDRGAARLLKGGETNDPGR